MIAYPPEDPEESDKKPSSSRWQTARQSSRRSGPAGSLKYCETCGKAVSRHGYTAERYERLVRFCSAWCRRNAPPRKVHCSRCGTEITRSYKTANPHCRPHCPRRDGARRDKPQPVSELHAEQVRGPLNLLGSNPMRPFQPVVYRLALPLLQTEIDWTVHTPEGERKLRQALAASPDDPDSIGQVFVVSIQPLRSLLVAV